MKYPYLILMENKSFALTYSPAVVRKCHGIASRGGNNLNNLASEIFEGITQVELAAWIDVMPSRDNVFAQIGTAVLPKMAYNDCVSVRLYLLEHGSTNLSAPSFVNCIAMMNCAIWQERTSLTLLQYLDWITLLDVTKTERHTFHDFVQICMEYEKEMD